MKKGWWLIHILTTRLIVSSIVFSKLHWSFMITTFVFKNLDFLKFPPVISDDCQLSAYIITTVSFDLKINKTDVITPSANSVILSLFIP
jgi:hypothetical protein